MRAFSQDTIFQPEGYASSINSPLSWRGTASPTLKKKMTTLNEVVLLVEERKKGEIFSQGRGSKKYSLRLGR